MNLLPQEVLISNTRFKPNFYKLPNVNKLKQLNKGWLYQNTIFVQYFLLGVFIQEEVFNLTARQEFKPEFANESVQHR